MASFFLNEFATFYLLYILNHSSIGLHPNKVRNGVTIAMDKLIYCNHKKPVSNFLTLFLLSFTHCWKMPIENQSD